MDFQQEHASLQSPYVKQTPEKPAIGAILGVPVVCSNVRAHHRFRQDRPKCRWGSLDAIKSENQKHSPTSKTVRHRLFHRSTQTGSWRGYQLHLAASSFQLVDSVPMRAMPSIDRRANTYSNRSCGSQLAPHTRIDLTRTSTPSANKGCTAIKLYPTAG